MYRKKKKRAFRSFLKVWNEVVVGILLFIDCPYGQDDSITGVREVQGLLYSRYDKIV